MSQNSETFNCIKPPRALWTWQWVTRYNPILLTIQLTELCIFKFLKLPLPSPGLFVFINKLVKSGKFTENECCEAILSFPLHIWIWLQTETKHQCPGTLSQGNIAHSYKIMEARKKHSGKINGCMMIPCVTTILFNFMPTEHWSRCSP